MVGRKQCLKGATYCRRSTTDMIEAGYRWFLYTSQHVTRHSL